MSIEQDAMNDAIHNKGMANNPKWTYQERQKYQAAYAAAQHKRQQEPQ